jgi:hypothetical protein
VSHLVHWTRERRLAGLWRFATAITVLNVAGHTVLGFEQAWIVPLIAMVTAYLAETGLEFVDATVCRRRPRYAGGRRAFIEFLLPTHISALAVGMLLYTNDQIGPVVFATLVAIGSKYMLRVPVGPAVAEDGIRPSRHFLNPSNFAITVTLLTFPFVNGTPPYQFTENVSGAWDVLLPLVVFGTGSLVNTRFTGRMPLIGAWVSVFACQAVVRAALNGLPPAAGLFPMTGLAFVLYTFYMITDPGTTPERPRNQVAFGAAVALIYALLVQAHQVFGLYYALTIVSTIRGVWLYYRAWQPRGATVRAGAFPAIRGGLGSADAGA